MSITKVLQKCIAVTIFCLLTTNLYADAVGLRSKAALDAICKSKKLTTSGLVVILRSDSSKEDIAAANRQLVDVIGAVKRNEDGSINWDPKKGEGHKLYWSLTQYSRMINDPVISSKLQSKTARMIKEVLWDYCNQFDKLEMTDIRVDKVLRVYESENHDMIRKGAFLMTAQALKDDSDWEKQTYQDGKSLKQHYDAWVKYFLEYFKVRAGKGLVSETNSVHYVNAYLGPIFVIYDLSESETLGKQAGKFLDLYFADVAQEILGGVRGGAKTRVYKDDDSYTADSDMTSYYTHILAGRPAKMPETYFASTLSAALSSYRLPDVVKDLMVNSDAKGTYSYISRRLAEGTNMDREEGKGYYQMVTSGALRRYSYCTPEYIFGFSTMDESKDYTLLYAQNQWMGLIAGDGPNSRIVVQGMIPLDKLDDSKRMPTGYYQLQGFGNKQASLFRRQKTDHQLEDKYTHVTVYVSDDWSVDSEDGWFFCRNSDSSVYCGFKAVAFGGEVKSEQKMTKKFHGRWIQFKDRNEILVMETAVAKDYSDFAAFKKDVKDNEMRWQSKDKFSYHASRDAGVFTMYSGRKLAELNGVTVDLHPAKAYESPFVQGDFDSSEITVTDTKGRSLLLNFDY